MGNPALQTVLYLLTVPTFILGSIIVPKLVKKYNKRDLVILSFIVIIIVNVLYLFAGYKPSFWIVLTVLLVTNLPQSIRGVLYWNMVADSVDYAEWKTGVRNDGLIYSIEGCFSKIIGAVGAMATGIVIAAINFVPNAITQTESTMKSLFYIPQIVTIVTTALAVIPYFFYDLDRHKYEQILSELKARKDEKAEEEA
jgi:Na+/melibiose symporter-like transporter